MKNKQKLLKYIAVGGFAYFTEMLSLYVLNNVLNLTAITSVAISFWIGFCMTFVLQKIITFKNNINHPKAIAKQVILYSALVAFNYGFSIFMVSLLHAKLNVYIIRTLTIGIIVCWNYIIYSKFIFNSHDETQTD